MLVAIKIGTSRENYDALGPETRRSLMGDIREAVAEQLEIDVLKVGAHWHPWADSQYSPSVVVEIVMLTDMERGQFSRPFAVMGVRSILDQLLPQNFTSILVIMIASEQSSFTKREEG